MVLARNFYQEKICQFHHAPTLVSENFPLIFVLCYGLCSEYGNLYHVGKTTEVYRKDCLTLSKKLTTLHAMQYIHVHCYRFKVLLSSKNSSVKFREKILISGLIEPTQSQRLRWLYLMRNLSKLFGYNMSFLPHTEFEQLCKGFRENLQVETIAYVHGELLHGVLCFNSSF